MTDVANSYLQTLTPMSDEEFAKQEELILKGEVQEPESPLASPEGEELSYTTPAVEVTPEETETPKDIWGYTKDIASGVATGWINGGTEVVHTLGNVADFVTQFQEGDPEYFSKLANEIAPRFTEENWSRLGMKVPVSTAGKLTQGAAQFLVGFAPALKAMRGIGALAQGTSTAARTAQGLAGTGTAGAIADLSAFNPYEERISNWAKNSGVAGLDNAVTEYLAANENDSELEGRLKQSLEGIFLGKATGAVMDVGTSVFSAIKGYKQTKQMLIAQAEGKPLPEKIPYMVDPTTGSTYTAIKGTDGKYTDPNTGKEISIPHYVVPIEKATVQHFTEEQQKDLTFKLLDGNISGAAKTFSGSINIDNLSSEESIRDLIATFNVAREQAVGKYSRSWEEAAKKQGVDLTTYSAKVKNLDSDVVNSRAVLEAVAYKAHEIIKIHRTAPSEETFSAMKRAVANLQLVEAVDSKNASEIARALAIRRRLADGGGIGTRIQTALNNSNNFSGNIDWDKFAQQVSDIPDGAGVVNLIKAYKQPTWQDAVTEVYVNNLFSPVTLAKNMLATNLSIGNSVVERYLGAALSKTSGSGEVTFREANTYALGLLKAIPEAIGVGFKSLKNDKPMFTPQANEFTENIKAQAFRAESFGIDSESTPLIQTLGKGLDYVGTGLRAIPGSTRWLMASDELMKVMVYRAEAGALAQRQAFKEGLQAGTPEFTAKIKEIETQLAKKDPKDKYYGLSMEAMDEAHRRTFTEDFSKRGQEILGTIRQYPLSYIVAPFIKTPVNLSKYMMRRTPALAGFSDYVEAELKAGGARADLVQAQMSAGAMYFAAGAAMAGAGLIQGDFTANWSVNRNLRQFGIQQRSFVFPDGTQQSIGGFDGSPLAFVLLSASTHEAIQAFIKHNEDRMDDDELASNVLEISMIPITAYMKYSANATWGQGVSAIFNAMQEDSWGEYLSQLAGNTVPAANTFKYVNQQWDIDPFVREVDSALEAVYAKLPYFSREVAPKATILGDPADVPQYKWKGLIPSYQLTPPDHPVYQELGRLQRLDPNKVVLGGIPNTYMGVQLDNNEKWNLSQLMKNGKVDGKTLIERLETLISDPEYAKLTDLSKETKLSEVYNKYKEVALKALLDDTLAYGQGLDRPYAEEWSLYPYDRSSPLANKVAREVAIQNRDKTGMFGDNNMSKEDFIKQYTGEIQKENFIKQLTQ